MNFVPLGKNKQVERNGYLVMQGSWLSLIPFLVAILFPIVTKQLLPGLVLSVLVGSFLYTRSILDAFASSIHAVLSSMEKEINLETILFLYLFGGLLGMMQIAGGVKGFDHLAVRWVRSPRTAYLFVWASVLITFVSPTFRIITVVPLLRTVSKRLHLSPNALGLGVDVSTVPVIALLPIGTAFVGYMLSIVANAIHQNHLHEDAFHVYFVSLFLNFFSWVMLLYGVFRTLIRPPVANESANANVSTAGNPLHTLGIEQELRSVKPRPLNLFVPLLLLIALTLYLLYRDGKRRGAHSLFEAFTKANATDMMLIAICMSIVLTFLFYLIRRELFEELVYHLFAGGNELIMAIVLLLLVWSLGTISQHLGFTNFVTHLVGRHLPGSILPALVFVIGSFIAYFLGSSFGTWGIMMPLAVTLGVSSGSSLPLTIGAVFASGTFGSFASPLGDETVNTATLLEIKPLDYANWKFPIALWTAGVTTLCYAVLGFLL
jgi:Na+/H+ antiporter NhaC